MKKMIKKTIPLCLALMLLISGTFTACKKESINTENHLEIKMYEAGNGTESIKNVAKRFMELNPGKTIEIKTNTDPRIIEGEIENGPSINTVDLYLAGGDFFNLVAKGSRTFDGVKYDSLFEPLNDIYENPATGETTLIKDKMYKGYSEYYYKSLETAYFAPWVGDWQGIVYNSKMFETYGWEIPLTTDHLYEVCEDILDTQAVSTNKNSLGQEIQITPFTYSREDSYWPSVYQEWRAQYDGIDVVDLAWQGKNAKGEYNPDCVASQGVLESMKVMERLLGTYEKVNGSVVERERVYTDNTLSFRTYTDSQSTFLYGEEARRNATGATTAAMMPNGGWLENEMSANFAEEIASGKVAFKAMKTPIISALANKTSFKDAENKDLKLREVIAYIDNNKQGEKPAFATDADIKIVEDARLIVTPQSSAVMIIPAYSSSKELAKEFIRFLYSDEGCKIFIEATQGIELPIYCDYTGVTLSSFQQSKMEIVKRENVVQFIYGRKYPMAMKGSLYTFTNTGAFGNMEGRYGVSNPKDYMTAEEMFTINYNATRDAWDRSMQDAGLLQ